MRSIEKYPLIPIIFDWVITLLSLLLAVSLRPYLSNLQFVVPVEVDVPIWLYLIFPTIWILGFLTVSVYDPQNTENFTDELRAVLLGVSLAVLICGSFLFLTYRDFSRWLFISFILINTTLLIGWRLIFSSLKSSSNNVAVKGNDLIGETSHRVQNSVAEYWQDLINFLRTAFSSGQDKVYMSIVLILGAVTRGYFLSETMRYDEAYTFLNFVNKEFSDLFFYPLPNNHVLHTILVKISVLLLGAHPETIRLPAFIFGFLTIPLTYLFARKLWSNSTGLIASLIVAISPYLISYSTNARGYSMMVFFGLLLAFVGTFFVDKPVTVRVITLSLVAALGLITIPSTLFAIVGITIWLGVWFLIENQSYKALLTKFAIPFVLGTAFLTIIFYWPVSHYSGGTETILSNRFVTPQPWDEFFSRLYPHTRNSFAIYQNDFSILVIYVALFLLFAGIFFSIYQKRWSSFLLLPSLFIGAGIVLFYNHRIPFTRTWMYLMPFIFVIVDQGFSEFNNKLTGKFHSILPILILIVGVYFSSQTISNQSIPGRVTSDIPAVVRYLKPMLDENDKVRGMFPYDWTTRFYVWYFDAHNGSTKEDLDKVDEFYIVSKDTGIIEDMTDQPVTELLDYGRLILYQKDQPEE